MQPRMVKGDPPDVINNSGAENMDVASLIEKGQVADLQPLLDAPSLYDPSKKVSETLLPGTLEKGRFGSDKVYQLNYSYTVYGVWYSKTNLEKLDLEYPKTWDEMLAVCAKAKKEGIAGWTYAGKHPYYFAFTLYPFIAKIGGQEVMKAIDNLEPNAWKNDAVKKAFEAYHELYAKGYVLKGTPGIDHIQSQTAVDQGQGAVHPERLLGRERGQGHHAQGLRDDGGAALQPRQVRRHALRDALGRGERAVHGPRAGEERRGRHGMAAHHAGQAVHAELHQAGLRRSPVSTAASEGLDLQSGLASAQDV